MELIHCNPLLLNSFQNLVTYLNLTILNNYTNLIQIAVDIVII